jgi:hypothetical protein
MDVVGDVLARERRSRDLAIDTPDGRERTYHDLITNAYKAANVLRYLGAREGATVAVHPDPGFHPTLAFLGAAGLGASVRFDPAAGLDAGDRVVLVPTAEESTADPAPGTNLAVFGGPPTRPETTHWEQELWSENPGMVPSTVEPADTVVSGPGSPISHQRLLALADAATRTAAIDADTRVVVRAPITDHRALAAGVVAPLVTGGTVVLDRALGAESDPLADDPARGDVAIVADEAVTPPEPSRLVVDAVSELSSTHD